MPEFPNLDYDPGPAGSSYSRVGPQPGRAQAAAQPRQPEPAPVIHVVRHEMAEELGAPSAAELGVRPAARRRRNHRKYRHSR